MPQVDPPYRLDPLQFIIRVRFGPKDPEPLEGGPDEKPHEEPVSCSGVLAGFGPVETCLTPGIFGVHPQNFPSANFIALRLTDSRLVCPIIPPNEFGDSCCNSGWWWHDAIIVNPNPLDQRCVDIPPNVEIPPGYTKWPPPIGQSNPPPPP